METRLGRHRHETPTTRGGLERKLGGLVLGALLGKKRKRKRR